MKIEKQRYSISAILLIALLMVLMAGVSGVQAGPETPFTVKLSEPDCTITSINSSQVSGELIEAVDPENVYFRWDFSNGMDRTLEKNLDTVTLLNVDDNVIVELDKGVPADFKNFNGTTIEAGDFKYTKMGRRPAPRIRRLELFLESMALEPAKNYVIKMGPDYEANNGNRLCKTYSWAFATTETGGGTVNNNEEAAEQLQEVNLQDIQGHWAGSYINELVASGAIKGYPDRTFKPDKTISRAEFANVLVKAFKLEARNGTVFADTRQHWAKDYISTAQAHGIVSGYEADKFGPDNSITREQMAVMIARAAKLDSIAGGKTFADGPQIATWAKDAVNKATENKIISGYPDNTFRPQASASRAEAVTLIIKALK